MQPADIERALLAAAAAQPPTAEDALERVQRRASRRRLVHALVPVAVVVVSLGAALTWRSAASTDVTVDVGSVGPPQSPVASAAYAPTGATALCFPQLNRIAREDPADVPLEGLPTSAPPLLVLHDTGSIWVLTEGRARQWAAPTADGGAGYLAAAFLPDGSVLASRLEAEAVVLDRLSAPAQSESIARLPYATKPDAPEGVCDIDGYLASFVVSQDRVVLARHVAGPVPHSCPYFEEDDPIENDPWRCQSKDATTFEIRSVDAMGGPGRSTGLTMGGLLPLPLVASSSRSSNYAIASQGPDGTPGGLIVETPTPQLECCFGGQNGTAFALSPDGTRLLWASSPTTLVDVSLIRPPIESEQARWTAPAPVHALAWSDDWIAVGLDGHVTFLPVADGESVDLRLASDQTITVLDWNR